MSQCAECGDPVGDLGDVCDRCGKDLCSDHRLRMDHECVVPGRESDAESEDGVALAAVVSVVFAVLAVGIWAASPAMVGLVDGVPGVDDGANGSPAGDDVGSSSPSDTPDGERFDENEFRSAVLSEMNDLRESRNRSALSRDPDRRAVAHGIAADLATSDYFENESASDREQFAIDQRLERANETCAIEVGDSVRDASAVYLETFYQRPIRTEEDTVRYRTNEQLARAIVERIRAADRNGGLLYEDSRRHDLGVHVTDERAVYVVYVVC
jgi:hypothetical protein